MSSIIGYAFEVCQVLGWLISFSGQALGMGRVLPEIVFLKDLNHQVCETASVVHRFETDHCIGIS